MKTATKIAKPSIQAIIILSFQIRKICRHSFLNTYSFLIEGNESAHKVMADTESLTYHGYDSQVKQIRRRIRCRRLRIREEA